MVVRGRSPGRYAALARPLRPTDLEHASVLCALEHDREVRLPLLAASTDDARAWARAINAERDARLPWQLFVAPAPGRPSR